MSKSIVLKDNNTFDIPFEFRGDFSNEEKSEVLNIYYHELQNALLNNATKEEFISIIKDIYNSKGYILMLQVTKGLSYSWNIFGLLPEMMIHKADELIKTNPTWPVNQSAAVILCGNALEVSINVKLIDKFKLLGRNDKADKINNDKGISIEDKFSLFLMDACNDSLKNHNQLWEWFKKIVGMRNTIIHLKINTDGTDIKYKDKNLDTQFVTEVIVKTKEILDYLNKL